MTDPDPLTTEQRQRLAVLYAVRDALHVELDAFDMVRCAHWVATGQEMPMVETGGAGDSPDADAANGHGDRT